MAKSKQWQEIPTSLSVPRFDQFVLPHLTRGRRGPPFKLSLHAIFTGSVLTLAQHDLLDKTVVHGDGTTTAAKKGGDNIGFNGHKRTKGDKVIPSVIATDWPLRWRKGRGTGT